MGLSNVLSQKQGFNPRVREGRDQLEQDFAGLLAVSIHASVKDATYSLLTSGA